LNRKYAKWVEFIETCLYVIKYKQGKKNIVVDALSSMYILLNTISARFLVFENVKALYANDSNFIKIYNVCGHLIFGKFYLMNGYLFKENWLCVPASSLRELLVCEVYLGGLMGHFGVAKTLDVLHDHLYLPNIKKGCATNLWTITWTVYTISCTYHYQKIDENQRNYRRNFFVGNFYRQK